MKRTKSPKTTENLISCLRSNSPGSESALTITPPAYGVDFVDGGNLATGTLSAPFQLLGGPREEALLQGKFASAKNQGDLDEEELLQRKFAPVQRQGDLEDEELLQGKFATNSLSMRFETGAEPSENRTGLPDRLKTGIEHLSGYAIDDVKVHYRSPKPAQLNAHAYTQGTDIHVAPGQERHLPHEAWHVVQQKQGRVKPTMQAKGVAINDDAGLEKEADVLGKKAFAYIAPRDDRPKELASTISTVLGVTQLFTIDQMNSLNEDFRPEVLDIVARHVGYPNGLERWAGSSDEEFEYIRGLCARVKEGENLPPYENTSVDSNPPSWSVRIFGQEFKILKPSKEAVLEETMGERADLQEATEKQFADDKKGVLDSAGGFVPGNLGSDIEQPSTEFSKRRDFKTAFSFLFIIPLPIPSLSFDAGFGAGVSAMAILTLKLTSESGNLSANGSFGTKVSANLKISAGVSGGVPGVAAGGFGLEAKGSLSVNGEGEVEGTLEPSGITNLSSEISFTGMIEVMASGRFYVVLFGNDHTLKTYEIKAWTSELTGGTNVTWSSTRELDLAGTVENLVNNQTPTGSEGVKEVEGVPNELLRDPEVRAFLSGILGNDRPEKEKALLIKFLQKKAPELLGNRRGAVTAVPGGYIPSSE